MIVAGFGFRQGATPDSLRLALAATGYEGRIDAVATLADKAPGLARLAADLGLPLITVPESDMPATETQTVSLASQAARGIGSVSEAVALVAIGPGAALLVPRQVSSDGQATCAIAHRRPE